MTAIRFADSLKYGWKALAFLLGILVVGGGTMALGVLVGRTEVGGSWSNPVITTSPELVAGILLVVVGFMVLVSGLFALWYKILTDAIAYGFGEEVGQIDLEPTVTVELEGQEVAAALVEGEGRQTTREPTSAHVETHGSVETATGSGPDAQPKTSPGSETPSSEVSVDSAEVSGSTDAQDVIREADSQVEGEQRTESASVSGPDTESPGESKQESETDTAVNDGPVKSEEWKGKWSDTESEESRVKRASVPSEKATRQSDERPEKTAEEIAFGNNSMRSPTALEEDSDREVNPMEKDSSTGDARGSTDPLAEETAIPDGELKNESEESEDSDDVRVGSQSARQDPLEDILDEDDS